MYDTIYYDLLKEQKKEKKKEKMYFLHLHNGSKNRSKGQYLDL